MRSGRYVVPVKAECRNEIPGLVHDTSSSGATVFVEPIGVVEANNEIRVLLSQEQAEIERILFELSAEAGSFADGIIQSYRAPVELNLIFAKGAARPTRMKATLAAASTQDGAHRHQNGAATRSSDNRRGRAHRSCDLGTRFRRACNRHAARTPAARPYP